MLKHVIQYLLLFGGVVSFPFLLYFAILGFNQIDAKGEGVVREASDSVSDSVPEGTPNTDMAMSNEEVEEQEVLDVDEVVEEDDILGIDEVGEIFWLKRRDSRMYETVSNLGWVADGIDEMEEEPVAVLIELGLDDPALAIQYIERPWFRDGLTEDEGSAFLGLTYVDSFVAEGGNVVGLLPWVVDGISEDEAWAALALWNLGVDYPDVVITLIAKPWFRDGITSDEADALTALDLLSYKTGTAGRFVDMPFMDSIEETDVLALFALHQVALLRWRNFSDSSEFHRFIAHPTIADGITDDETVLVTLVSSAFRTNPDLAITLFEPGEVMVETRSIELPVAGEVDLVIARVEPGAARSMDHLESSVRFAERYMGEPFPIGTVVVLYADVLEEGIAGLNVGTSVIIHPEFDVDDGSEEAYEAEFVTIHEVAHFYWHSSSQDWIDEGAAEVLSLAYAEDSTGLEADELFSEWLAGYECPVESLAVLEAMDETEVGDCPYKLGLEFFFDVHRAVGQSDFQRGYRNLYQSAKDVWDYESEDARGIAHIKESFGATGTEQVISEWYGYSR